MLPFSSITTSTPYAGLALYIAFTLLTSLALSLLNLPALFLRGLFTYVHPDHSGTTHPRAAIRRPGSSDPPNLDLRRRGKKDRAEFDEANAQIFRLKLDAAHLATRVHFPRYRNLYHYLALSLSTFLLRRFVVARDGAVSSQDGAVSSQDGAVLTPDVVPVALGAMALLEGFASLVRTSVEKSASRRSEKQLSVISALLGFVLAALICFEILPNVFPFRFRGVDAAGKLCLSLSMGCFAGLLFVPAVRASRSFWLGTDQLRWNLSIISCSFVPRLLLYTNYLLLVLASSLWITPFATLLTNNRVQTVAPDASELAGSVGLSPSDFENLRIRCLLASGTMQLVVVRPNLQMFLNEAVLCWYQRLHSSKVPDLEFSRTKVFLHNHYLCVAVLQFFAPPGLVLLLLCLSGIDGNPFRRFDLVCRLFPCSVFVREVALCMAWWVVFVSAVFASATLVCFRRGILYVS